MWLTNSNIVIFKMISILYVEIIKLVSLMMYWIINVVCPEVAILWHKLMLFLTHINDLVM